MSLPKDLTQVIDFIISPSHSHQRETNTEDIFIYVVYWVLYFNPKLTMLSTYIKTHLCISYCISLNLYFPEMLVLSLPLSSTHYQIAVTMIWTEVKMSSEKFC